MIKVKLNKRMIARDADGKSEYCNKGTEAYMDEATFKYHAALGDVEVIEDEPEVSAAGEPEPDADAVTEPAEAADDTDALA